jgi:AraC-like DNA-binding protein
MFTPSNQKLSDQSRTDNVFHPGNHQNELGTFHNECERFTRSIQKIYEAISRSDIPSGNETLRPVLNNLTARIVAFEQLLAHDDSNTVRLPINRKISFMEAVNAILDRELDNAELTVHDLAHELCMSQSTLYRLFREVFSCKPNDLIRNYRLARALDLLQKDEARIKEIAYRCGFNNLSYFSKCFKAKYGELPSQVLKTKFTLHRLWGTGSVQNH